jgi:hypothetical protein
MKYLLCISYVNRSDLLHKALLSIRPFLSQALVIDNSKNHELKHNETIKSLVKVEETPIHLTYTQVMNYIHVKAAQRHCDVLFYMHNDAETYEHTFPRLLSFVEQLQQENHKWGLVYTFYDILAAFNMEAIRQAGPWDMNLPMYFSDNDYYRRIKLLNYELVESHLPMIHHGSSTIKSDPVRLIINGITFPLYQSYYQQKWGGEPGKETFHIPFQLFPINPVPNYLSRFDS